MPLKSPAVPGLPPPTRGSTDSTKYPSEDEATCLAHAGIAPYIVKPAVNQQSLPRPPMTVAVRWRRTSALPCARVPKLAMKSADITLMHGDFLWYCQSHPLELRDDGQDQAEPVFCVSLKRFGHPDCRRPAISLLRPNAEPDDGKTRHECDFFIGDRECLAITHDEALTRRRDPILLRVGTR